MPDPAAFMPAGAIAPEADEMLELPDAAGAAEGPEDMAEADGSASDPPSGTAPVAAGTRRDDRR